MRGNINQRHGLEIIGSASGPTVLVAAGVHGDEYEPMIAAMRLTEKLAGLLKKGKVLIDSVVNASAYETGSRYGSDGLDLARICPGRHDGSISEVAASVISERISESDYFIDMHTGGRLFDIFPLAGYMMHSDRSVLEKQRMMASSFGLPMVWGTDREPNGRTLSVARDANVPAIYVEYGGGDGCNETIIQSYVNGCLNVLSKLEMIEKDPEKTQVSVWVEDNSPDSGYLQGKMLSDYDGIFVPTVNNGDQVLKGQHWGYIFDPLTNSRHEINAESDGMVMFLRRLAKVHIGDSLGGILGLNNKIKIHE